MNIVELAKTEVESANVTYMEFALDYKNENNIIYCFYEGYEDRSFYSHRIRDSFSQCLYFDYVTNGKGNLLKTFELIQNHVEYQKSTNAYFVDKDYEPEIDNPDIFTTKTYSIENLFVFDCTFKNILLNEFNITHRDQDFLKITELFKNLKNEFLAKSLLLNAWLSCQTDLRINSGQTTRLKIDSTIKNLLDSTVKSDFSGINFPIELSSKESIENLFNGAEEIPIEILERKLIEFRNLDLEIYSRGKFLTKFLVCFLNKFKDEIGRKNSAIFSKKFTCRLRFEELTNVSQLTNNVNTPVEIFQYFEHLKSKQNILN